MITMGGETQDRIKMSPVVSSETEVQPCGLSNYLRVGDETIPGVTIEGVGVMVPGTKCNNIYEQPQDSRILMTQQMNGTSGSVAGTELGLIAEVGEGQGKDNREGK